MQFEYSQKGCAKAKKWLKKNGLYPTCVKYELSTDGWNIIACANAEWEKLNAKLVRNTKEN